jgi:hypothetical protein
MKTAFSIGLLFLLAFPEGVVAQDRSTFTIEGDLTPLKEEFGVADDSLSLAILSGFEEEEPVALDGLRFRYAGSATKTYPAMEYLFLRNESKRGELVAAIPFFREPGNVRIWCHPLPEEGFFRIEVTGTPTNDLVTQRKDDHSDLNYDMLALAQDSTLSYEELAPLIERMIARQDSLIRYWYRDSRDTDLAPVMAIQHYYSSNNYRELADELVYLRERFPGHSDLHDLETILLRMPGIQPGDTLPDAVLRDRDGRPVRLSELAGDHYLLIDPWATVNGASLSDFRRLRRLPKNYEGKPLVLVGISTDLSRKVWLRTLRRHRPTGIQLWDEHLEASRAFHLSTYPTRLLVGPEGVVIRKGNFTTLERPTEPLSSPQPAP